MDIPPSQEGKNNTPPKIEDFEDEIYEVLDIGKYFEIRLPPRRPSRPPRPPPPSLLPPPPPPPPEEPEEGNNNNTHKNEDEEEGNNKTYKKEDYLENYEKEEDFNDNEFHVFTPPFTEAANTTASSSTVCTPTPKSDEHRKYVRVLGKEYIDFIPATRRTGNENSDEASNENEKKEQEKGKSIVEDEEGSGGEDEVGARKEGGESESESDVLQEMETLMFLFI